MYLLLLFVYCLSHPKCQLVYIFHESSDFVLLITLSLCPEKSLTNSRCSINIIKGIIQERKNSAKI